MEILKKAILIMKDRYICNNCLGRNFAELGSGLSNQQRGKIIRQFISLLIDSGEKIEIEESNLYGIRFRNVKIKPKKPEKCKICKNFFLDKIDHIADNIINKSKGIEFRTFLVGCVPSDEMVRSEEKLWEMAGIEFCEPIKSEINRELGKIIEMKTDKRFDQKNPDITFVANLNDNSTKMDVRSLYIYGKYQKLVRGIPQTKWVCKSCSGKGCVKCKGEGKLYKTSVQEEIEKPFLKVLKGGESSFHGEGREDIDARCLGWRPFVLEIKKPKIRKVDLNKILKIVNRYKKVKIKELKFVDKSRIKELKFARVDKTYLARVKFSKKIDRKNLKGLKGLTSVPILQHTPERVSHRRAKKIRKRHVKKITWRIKSAKDLEFKITAESGLYIKELITGDNGRTEPNIAGILENKVKKIELDVIKIHIK